MPTADLSLFGLLISLGPSRPLMVSLLALLPRCPPTWTKFTSSSCLCPLSSPFSSPHTPHGGGCPLSTCHPRKGDGCCLGTHTCPACKHALCPLTLEQGRVSSFLVYKTKQFGSKSFRMSSLNHSLNQTRTHTHAACTLIHKHNTHTNTQVHAAPPCTKEHNTTHRSTCM